MLCSIFACLHKNLDFCLSIKKIKESLLFCELIGGFIVVSE